MHVMSRIPRTDCHSLFTRLDMNEMNKQGSSAKQARMSVGENIRGPQPAGIVTPTTTKARRQTQRQVRLLFNPSFILSHKDNRRKIAPLNQIVRCLEHRWHRRAVNRQRRP